MIRAGGAVLWRRTDDGGLEVAAIHRPRCDDWTLPKGKLDRGEEELQAAIREVIAFALLSYARDRDILQRFLDLGAGATATRA